MSGVVLVALVACATACGGERDAQTAADGQPVQRSAAVLGEKVFPMSAAGALDGRGRDAWQHPRAVIAALGIEPGMRVADVGCGTGYFTVRLVRAVGSSGRVIAVDIQQGMLDILGARLSVESRSAVELRLSDPDRPLEPDDAVDLVLCANTLHEVDDQVRFVRSLASGLAPGGRAAFINWLPEETAFGPPLERRVAPDEVTALATGAGLRFERAVTDVLELHSFLIYGKPR